MLALAVTATLAANVGYGLPYGLAGAALSGWPAVAFIGCAEMAIGMVRRARSAADHRPASTAATTRPARRPRAAARRGQIRRSQADIEAEALAALPGQPGMTGPQLAATIGVSDRTARRIRARLTAGNGHVPSDSHSDATAVGHPGGGAPSPGCAPAQTGHRPTPAPEPARPDDHHVRCQARAVSTEGARGSAGLWV